MERETSDNRTGGAAAGLSVRPVPASGEAGAENRTMTPAGSEGPRREAFPTWRDVLAMLGMLVLGTLAGGVVAGLLLHTGSASQGLAMFVGYVVQFSSAILFSLWLKVVRGGGRPLLRFSLRGGSPVIVLWGVILTFAASVVIEPLLELFPEEQFAPLQQLVGMGGWMMLTSVVVAPVMEEIFFRGIVQESVAGRHGPVAGILTASVIFAAAHYTVPPQALNAFCVALVLGCVYARTRSLVPVILIHAVNNAIAWFTMVLEDGRIETTRAMIGDESVYRIVYAVAVAVLAAGCVQMFFSLRRRKRPEGASGDNKLNA